MELQNSTFYSISKKILIKFFCIFMKFVINIQKTALHMAIEKENIEIIKLLLSNPKIDVNLLFILN